MACILSPFLSAKGFALQGGIKLSESARETIGQYIQSNLLPYMKTPAALAESINEAAAAGAGGT